jgi:xanthine dehydrogenase small subunit
VGAIEFHLNGEPVALTGISPTTTLLNWLRYERGLTGTKEGCAEGDCGACTVAMRDAGGDWMPVCACILLIGMAHGREIRTVEALSAGGELHPIQRALAEGHGTQCGFCTPGFVMSLWAAGQTGRLTDRDSVCEALSGNLCRCTGYGPIIDAALSVEWRKDERGPARIVEYGPLSYTHDGQTFWSPATIDELAELIATYPEATVLSGATDVGLWVTKHDFNPAQIIYTGHVAEMARIDLSTNRLWIGAGATYRSAADALAEVHPGLSPLINRIGGAQVRAMGTIGGNIANGSPIGDMPPALIAAGSSVHLRRGALRRAMPLEEFFLEYGKQALNPGEFVEAVEVPVATTPSTLACYKIAKRHDQDISSVLGCFAIETNGRETVSARIAFGGMAGIPKRAHSAEAVLVGAPWIREIIDDAMAAMADDFAPLSDHRASAEYRLSVAQNLLLKYFLERTEPDARLQLPAASVASA